MSWALQQTAVDEHVPAAGAAVVSGAISALSGTCWGRRGRLRSRERWNAGLSMPLAWWPVWPRVHGTGTTIVDCIVRSESWTSSSGTSMITARTGDASTARPTGSLSRMQNRSS